MKKNIRINYIFWKEGPLLPGFLIASKSKYQKSPQRFDT